MKKWKDLLFTFACVTTCVVFTTAVYITVFWPPVTFGTEILWQILFVSFLCSLGIYFYPEQAAGRRMAWIPYILHYIEVNAAVLGCGIRFGWFYADNLTMVLGMVAAIALVFLFISVILWNRGKRMAALMNERLKEYQQEETQTDGRMEIVFSPVLMQGKKTANLEKSQSDQKIKSIKDKKPG